MNIFVGNLNSQATESQLRNLFSEFGEVKSVKIPIDNYSGRARDFGFVEMAEKAAGENAILKLNNTSLNAQNIVVNEAKPKSSIRSYSGNR